MIKKIIDAFRNDRLISLLVHPEKVSAGIHFFTIMMFAMSGVFFLNTLASGNVIILMLSVFLFYRVYKIRTGEKRTAAVFLSFITACTVYISNNIAVFSTVMIPPQMMTAYSRFITPAYVTGVLLFDAIFLLFALIMFVSIIALSVSREGLKTGWSVWLSRMFNPLLTFSAPVTRTSFLYRILLSQIIVICGAVLSFIILILMSESVYSLSAVHSSNTMMIVYIILAVSALSALGINISALAGRIRDIGFSGGKGAVMILAAAAAVILFSLVQPHSFMVFNSLLPSVLFESGDTSSLILRNLYFTPLFGFGFQIIRVLLLFPVTLLIFYPGSKKDELTELK